MARPSSLHDYATHAPSVLGIDVEASILLRQYGADISAASSTPAAARCDRVEALAGDGPCIDAMDELRVRVVTDVAAEQSWHAWRTQAVDEGFATAIAVPGEVGGSAVIALNLYSRDASPWDARALAAAESYTQLVAAAVRLHLEVAELEDRATGLYRTMSDEVAIQRAVGTIMATNDCSAQEAARILDSAAATRGVSRREVAETILRTLASEES